MEDSTPTWSSKLYKKAGPERVKPKLRKVELFPALVGSIYHSSFIRLILEALYGQIDVVFSLLFCHHFAIHSKAITKSKLRQVSSDQLIIITGRFRIRKKCFSLVAEFSKLKLPFCILDSILLLSLRRIGGIEDLVKMGTVVSKKALHEFLPTKYKEQTIEFPKRFKLRGNASKIYKVKANLTRVIDEDGSSEEILDIESQIRELVDEDVM